MTVFSCLAATLLGAVTLTGVAQQIQISKENKTIAVTTSDVAEALSDTAVVTVGFRLYGKDQDATYADAAKISNAIMAALMSAGVAKEAVESESQSLTPLELNGDTEKARYGQGMRFESSQSWRVTVPAASAATVLQRAITAGANDSGAIQWQLREEDALEADAAKKALKHAGQIASGMASGLGVKLGPLVYASNQTPPRGIFPGAVSMSAQSAVPGQATRNTAPLALSPARISKTATVYAVFAIE